MSGEVNELPQSAGVIAPRIFVPDSIGHFCDVQCEGPEEIGRERNDDPVLTGPLKADHDEPVAGLVNEVTDVDLALLRREDDFTHVPSPMESPSPIVTEAGGVNNAPGEGGSPHA